MTSSEIVTLVLSLIALGVAVWSAMQASQANQIAREAARATVAALPIEFMVRPVHAANAGGPMQFVGLELRNEGASLFVHSVRLEGFGVISASGSGSLSHEPLTDRSLPIELVVSHPLQLPNADAWFDAGQLPVLPLRMHRGEVASFRLPEPLTPGALSSLEVRVGYSIGGEREEASRHVHGHVVSYRERHNWHWADPK